MKVTIISRALDAAGRVLTHTSSLLAMLLFVGAWSIFDRESLDWHAAATLITFIIAIIIERNARRDTTALQAKLDELIHATDGARNEIAAVENRPIDEIEARRR